MKITNTLLVVIDPTSKEQPALAQAMVLSKKLNMELELFICNTISPLNNTHGLIEPEALQQHYDTELDEHEQYLENLMIPLREQGLNVNKKIVKDRPLHEGILRRIEEINPFMVFKDTHYHHKISRVILQNTDWNLIRTCPVPLFLVKPTSLWNQPVIVSAINPVDDRNNAKQLDEDIVQMGKKMTSLLQGRHFIFHAYQDLNSLSVVASPLGEAYSEAFSKEKQDRLRDEHQRAVYQVTDKFDIDKENITLKASNVESSLLDFVEKINADLLIMGGISKSRMAQVFIGGTAERVLDDIHCDILVLKPQNFETSDS